MSPVKKIIVNETPIGVDLNNANEDYISLTDMTKGFDEGGKLIEKWLINKSTIEFLGVWEHLNNADFKTPEFGVIESQAGSNKFYMSVGKFVTTTNAIGLKTKAGRYGGTYAHIDIAYHFGMWLSPEFNLLVVKEYQRLRRAEDNPLLSEWTLKRSLSKTNYTIHTDAIKDYLIPQLSETQKKYAYPNEADLLNVALWNCTAKQWREANPNSEGQNIRDMASINELIVLSNMESYNAELTRQGVEQSERLDKLRDMAQTQINSLNKRNVEHKFRALVDGKTEIDLSKN